MATSLLSTPSPLLPLSSRCCLCPAAAPKTPRWVVGVGPCRSHHSGSFAVRAVAEANTVLDPFDIKISNLKLNLLSAVSGLNRGLAANVDDVKKVDLAAKQLEDAAGLVDLNNDIEKLQGQWRLAYSSAFSSRSLGGSRPGPSIGQFPPLILGQVFQRIDVLSKDFDNIVELELVALWPFPKIELTATLAHKFEIIGSSKIKITFVNTTVKPRGIAMQLPEFEIPRLPEGLRPPSNNTGTGEFEVTYADSDLRITRGDRSELRVFVVS